MLVNQLCFYGPSAELMENSRGMITDPSTQSLDFRVTDLPHFLSLCPREMILITQISKTTRRSCLRFPWGHIYPE